MTSRRDVIPHAHKNGIWGTSVKWSLTCHGERSAHSLDKGKYGMPNLVADNSEGEQAVKVEV